MSITVLLEASPRRASDGAVVPLRMVWNARKRADFFGVQWLPVLHLPPSFETDIGFDGTNFGQGALPNIGTMQIILDKVTAAWPALIWKNAALTIKAAPWPRGGLPVDAADGDFAVVANAKAASISAADSLLTLVVLDAGEVLRRPVQPVLFGTSGIALLDGADAKDHFGSPVPVGWGVLSKVKGRLVDRTNLIYLFLSRAATATGGFYDGGAPFTLGVARANLAALIANVPAAGTVDYCLNAAGLVLARPWAKPTYLFTADLTAGSTQAADIANSIVTSRTALTFGAGVVAAFNGIQAAPCGRYVDDGSTIAEQLDRLFAGLGSFWRLTRTGTLDIKRIGFAGVAAVSFGSWQVMKIERRGTIMPTGRRTLGYAHNSTVHGENDIAKLLTENIEIDYSAVTGSTKPENNATNVRTYRTAWPPPLGRDADLWFDTRHANKGWRFEAGPLVSVEYAGATITYGGATIDYTSGAWVEVDDTSIVQAQRTANAKTGLVAQGSARDTDVVSFSLPAAPKIIFGSGGISAPSGANTIIDASGLSATGFTMRAVYQTVGTVTGLTDTGAVAGVSGEPDLVINRSTGTAPFDGRFTFTYSVTIAPVRDIAPGEPGEPGSITISCFVKRSGAWIEVSNAFHNLSGTFQQVVSPGTVDFGAGAEFGVSVTSQDGVARLTGFTSVAYATATVSGETTLTPSNSSAIQWSAWL